MNVKIIVCIDIHYCAAFVADWFLHLLCGGHRADDIQRPRAQRLGIPLQAGQEGGNLALLLLYLYTCWVGAFHIPLLPL